MENKELQKKREDEKFCPEKIGSYFRVEWKVLLTITISGLIYNLGLLAEPWFEGRMTGMLVDILRGNGTFANMLFLVIGMWQQSGSYRYPDMSNVFMYAGLQIM